jgi:hypothetical protein
MNVPLTSLQILIQIGFPLYRWKGLENEISKLESHSPFEHLKH